MENRFPVISFLLVVILMSGFSGCTSSPAQQPLAVSAGDTLVAGDMPVTTGAGEPGHTIGKNPAQTIADQLAAVQSGNAIWCEAYRMFSNMKETGYVHPPYTVDETAGIYKFDCLGFVDHVLMNANPASYKEIGKGVNPSIESYAAYFNKLSVTAPDSLGWIKVTHPADLQPGDICLWLRPTTLDTGHMWIIAGDPKINTKRGDEVVVRIFDSSVPHSDDSRTYGEFRNGLGSGILGMMVDGEGNPIGLYWEGGVSTSAGERDTTIVCGRLNHKY